MNRYPADEGSITDVEMGRRCSATVSMAIASRPAPGEVILFAQGSRRAGETPLFLQGGDCVQVLLTDVVDLGASEAFAGEAVFRLSWAPPARPESPTLSRRGKPARES